MSSEVPEGWSISSLGEMAAINMGQSPPSSVVNDSGDGLPFLQGNAEFGTRFPSPRQHCSKCPKTVDVGDILLSVRAPVGEVNVAPERLCIGRGLAGLRSVNGDQDFFYYALGGLAPAFARLSQGSTFDAINGKDLRGIPLILPPLDEQRRIAEVLRSVDVAIYRNQQYLAQASSVRAALLQQHFHMAEWAGGQPLPDGWEIPLLDTVAKRGSGHTPNKKIDRYWNGGIKWVSLQDTKKLDQVYISATAQQISDDGIRNSSAVLHPDGVVVISRDATVGRSAITVGPMAVSQHFIAYRCGQMLENHYLYYWLQRMKPVFERIGAGSTIKTIGLPFFKSLRIALPPLDQQSALANVMLDADEALMSAAATIQSLHKLKAVLMNDLLSGHVRVPA